MIRLYCKKCHGTKTGLCPECKALAEYACDRSNKCPFMDNKTFCSNCKVHCYKPEMRNRIRQVMRFSGPRMIFHHPVMAMQHLISSRREAARLAEGTDGIWTEGQVKQCTSTAFCWAYHLFWVLGHSTPSWSNVSIISHTDAGLFSWLRGWYFSGFRSSFQTSFYPQSLVWLVSPAWGVLLSCFISTRE